MGEQIRKPEREQEAQVDESLVKAAGEAAVKGEKLKGDIDDILDEIDTVLESDAEEFVKSYVQKGGE